MRKLLMMSLFVMLVVASRPTFATIVSGAVTGGSAFTAGGTFQKLGVPLGNPFGPANSVGNDNFQSHNLYGFDEDQNITLLVNLVVDEGPSPIPAGTVVASHYIFFDPANTEGVLGSVTFDSKVLGILTSRTRLAASDFLANPGVNYLNPTARGLESGDSVTISGTYTIAWNTRAASPGDYVRVLTATSPAALVPEPSMMAMALVGVGLVGVARARRGLDS